MKVFVPAVLEEATRWGSGTNAESLNPKEENMGFIQEK